MNVERHYKLTKIVAVSSFILLSSIQITAIPILLEYETKLRTFFYYFNFAFVYGSYAALALMFSLYLANVYARFEAINCCIRMHFPTNDIDFERALLLNEKKDIKVRSQFIIKLANLHDKLVDISKEINKCFGFQV